MVAPSQLEARVAEGWTLVDIRDERQHANARLKAAAHVPLFVADESQGASVLGRKAVVFGTIGWWGGQGLTKENMNFVSGIEAAALKAGGRASAKVLLVCQTGLRSEVAAQRLLAMGFGQVAYVVGGLNEARGLSLDTEGEMDIWDAGKGGLSQYFQTIIRVLLVVLAVAYVALEFMKDGQ
jgi:rhodanese-related sulfurtransferase